MAGPAAPTSISLRCRATRTHTCGEKDCSGPAPPRTYCARPGRKAMSVRLSHDALPMRWDWTNLTSARARTLSSITPRIWPALLREPVRGSRRLRDRRVWRLRQHVDGRRAWKASPPESAVFFPHSLGLLYLAITQYLGFPKVRRRIQSDGACTIRRSHVSSTSFASSFRSATTADSVSTSPISATGREA